MTKLYLIHNSITQEPVDAIVNAANSSLQGGGGVDGAIHRAGGPAILAESRMLAPCKAGDAKTTTAGNLPAKYVIHTVGPVYRGGENGEPEILAQCHRRAIEEAAERGCKSVAFPAISCGVYGYPVHLAAPIALKAAMKAAKEHGIEEVKFVFALEAILNVFDAAVQELGFEVE